MSSKIVVQTSIKLVLPGIKQIHDDLITQTEILYQKSKRQLTLPQAEETQRLHICALLVAQKLRIKLSLAMPTDKNIALEPKSLKRLKIQIENSVRALSPPKSRHKTGKQSRPSSPMKIPKLKLVFNDSPTSTNKKNVPTVINTPSMMNENKENSYANKTPPSKIKPIKKTTPKVSTPNVFTPNKSKRAFDDGEIGYGDLAGMKEHHSSINSSEKRGGINLTKSFLSMEQSTEETSSTPSKRRRLSTSTLILTDSQDIFKDQLSNTQSSPIAETSEDIPSFQSTPIRPQRKLKNTTKLGSKESFSLLTPRPQPDSFVNKRAKHRHSPRKSSPLKSQLDTQDPLPKSNVNSDEVATNDIIEICNIFKFPSTIAYQILTCFKFFSPKIKDKWGFVCGLLVIVYTRVFNQQIRKRIDLKGKFHERLLKWQRGGMTFSDLSRWTKLSESMLLDTEDWIHQIEITYNYRDCAVNESDYEDDSLDDSKINDNIRFLYTCGGMINSGKDYLSKYHTMKYDDWVKRVKSDIIAMK